MEICLQRAYGGKNCSPHVAVNQECNGLDGDCASFLPALDLLWMLLRAWRERHDREDEMRVAVIEPLKNEVKTARCTRLLSCFKQFSFYFSIIMSDPDRNFDLPCLSYTMITACHSRNLKIRFKLGIESIFIIPSRIPYNRTQPQKHP